MTARDPQPTGARHAPTDTQSDTVLRIDDATIAKAMVIAMGVRNAMEHFHVQHLSDEQMAELNPIIRNAIATGLFAIANMDRDDRCNGWVGFQSMLVPPYWEAPQLLDDLTGMRGTFSALERTTCRHCGQPITRPGRWWIHTDDSRSRGCRAASFTETGGWNDDLDRSWTAQPPKG